MILETPDVPAMVHSLNFAGATLLTFRNDGYQIVCEAKTVTLMHTELVEIVWKNHEELGGQEFTEELDLNEWTMTVVGHVVIFTRKSKKGPIDVFQVLEHSISDVFSGKSLAEMKQKTSSPKVMSFTFILDK